MRINWKLLASALAATLTTLAALPYQLGDIANIIPPAWKPRIVAVGLVATIVLRVWNSVTQPPKQP